MKQQLRPMYRRVVFWLLVAIVAAVTIVIAFWAIHGHSKSAILSDLKGTDIYTTAPAPESVVLAQGSESGFTNVEVTQDPTIAKVYAVAGRDVGTLVRYYEQTYPSYKYRWHVDYYFPSPGVSAVNLFGQQGVENVAVYIGPTPYKPQHPALSLKQAPAGYATYVTILLSEKG